jgi:pimeloyl-ACP methyl ester carboxylesterase
MTALTEALAPGAAAETTGPLRSAWDTVNGLRMHARVADEEAPADAPAVVLVHGVGVSSRYLVPTAERLAPFYRVYAPDLPGFGRSERPPRLLDVPGLADALAGWMKAAGLPSAALLGNSMGCQVIVDLAVRRPKLVERAVLVGPTVDPAARSLMRQLGRGARDLFGEPVADWPPLAADYLIAGPLRTVRTLDLAVHDPVAEKLPRVRAPVLVVRGERDPIAPPDWAEEMVRLLPAGRLAVLPGAHHIPNDTDPDELVRVVRPFLEEARPVT